MLTQAFPQAAANRSNARLTGMYTDVGVQGAAAQASAVPRQLPAAGDDLRLQGVAGRS
jgi:hypothetical protein